MDTVYIDEQIDRFNIALQKLNDFFNKIDTLPENQIDNLKKRYTELYGAKNWDTKYNNFLERNLWLDIFRKEHNDKTLNMFSFDADDIEKYDIPSFVVGCSGRADLFAKYLKEQGFTDIRIVPCAKTLDIGKKHIDGHQIIAVKLYGDDFLFFNPAKKNKTFDDALIDGYYNKYDAIDATQHGYKNYLIADIITPEEHAKIKSYDDLHKIYDSPGMRNISRQINNIFNRFKTKRYKEAIGKLLVQNYFSQWIKYTDDWYSSSQKLEQNLQSLGIKLPQKLYYEYKFPNDMTNAEFYNLTLPVMTIHLLTAWLVNDDSGQYAVDDLYEHLYRAELDLSDFFKFNIYLAMEKPDVVQKNLVKAYKTCKPMVDNIMKQIKQLNPELQKIQNVSIHDLWSGCCYGFAPTEIDFFAQLEKKREYWDNQGIDSYYYEHNIDPESKHAFDNMDKIESLTGFWPNYILAPSTSDMILKAIEQNRTLVLQHSKSDLAH